MASFIVIADTCIDNNIVIYDSSVTKTIHYTRAAFRALRRRRNMASRIVEKINAYAEDPTSLSNMAITMSTGERRLRVGDFRVIFRETSADIEILDIGPRGHIYD